MNRSNRIKLNDFKRNTAVPAVLIFFTLISNLTAQTFEEFCSRVKSAPEAQRTALVDSFMNAVSAFPFIENDSLAHFIFLGPASRVNVPGDANNWNPAGFPMTRLATTNLWYRTEKFESDARLDYKFVIDGSRWILDPENPRQVTGGFGPNSELSMPAYIQPDEIKFLGGIPHGSLRDTTFFSAHLGNSRTVRIYLPPFYERNTQRYPVILFHDGLEYVSLAKANNVIDYLIWQNRIQPILAVFVPPVNRTPEYVGRKQNAFTAFIVEELMPWVDGRYRTRKEPENRALLGASNGGNIALWIGLNHPEVFGKIAAQSSNVEQSIRTGFQNRSKLDLQFYLDLGTYDIPLLIPRVKELVSILQSRGYPVQYFEFHEGHSWGNWRAHIDHALMQFFPSNASSIHSEPSKPKKIKLQQNYPNPFNPTTTFAWSLVKAANVQLNIYNTRGQLIARLGNHRQDAGEHSAVWDGTQTNGKRAASGIYFYELQIDGKPRESKKLILLK